MSRRRDGHRPPPGGGSGDTRHVPGSGVAKILDRRRFCGGAGLAWPGSRPHQRGSSLIPSEPESEARGLLAAPPPSVRHGGDLYRIAPQSHLLQQLMHLRHLFLHGPLLLNQPSNPRISGRTIRLPRSRGCTKVPRNGLPAPSAKPCPSTSPSRASCRSWMANCTRSPDRGLAVHLSEGGRRQTGQQHCAADV